MQEIQTLEADAPKIAVKTKDHSFLVTDEMTKRDAQKLLVAEMNQILVRKNQQRLRNHRNAVNAWYEKLRNRQKAGQFPKEPIFINTFKGLKNLNDAVFMARQRGGYGALLERAGY